MKKHVRIIAQTFALLLIITSAILSCSDEMMEQIPPNAVSSNLLPDPLDPGIPDIYDELQPNIIRPTEGKEPIVEFFKPYEFKAIGFNPVDVMDFEFTWTVVGGKIVSSGYDPSIVKVVFDRSYTCYVHLDMVYKPRNITYSRVSKMIYPSIGTIKGSPYEVTVNSPTFFSLPDNFNTYVSASISWTSTESGITVIGGQGTSSCRVQSSTPGIKTINCVLTYSTGEQLVLPRFEFKVMSLSPFPIATIDGPEVGAPQTSLFYHLKDGNGNQIPYNPAIEVEWECTDQYGNYVGSALMPFWDEYKTHLGFPQSGKYILKARFKKYENGTTLYSNWISILINIRN